MGSTGAGLLVASSNSPAWFCLRSKPKHENIAAIYLRKSFSIDAFAPRIRFQRLRQQRKMWATEALFPGYLFACFDLNEHGRAVQHAHAIQGILKFGKRHATIASVVVEQLRALVGPEELAVVQQTEPVLGQEIIVAEGPFRGLQSIITGYLPAKDRVKVLLHLLGHETEVEMPASAVTPVEQLHPLKSRFGLSEVDPGKTA